MKTKEQKSIYQKEYRRKNKDKLREWEIQYQRNHRDKIIKKSRNYYAKNRERLLAKHKIWHEAHKEERREKLIAWRKRPEVRLHQKNYDFKHKYGITVLEYDELVKKQEGKCALCGKIPRKLKKIGLHVDHDHRTGKVRGLLCSKCNTSIGALGDTGEGLIKAAMYVDGGLVMEMPF